MMVFLYVILIVALLFCVILRRGGLGGMARKPSDLAAVHGCSACHDVLDSRAKGGASDGELLDALLRTLAEVDKHFKLVKK